MRNPVSSPSPCPLEHTDPRTRTRTPLPSAMCWVHCTAPHPRPNAGVLTTQELARGCERRTEPPQEPLRRKHDPGRRRREGRSTADQAGLPLLQEDFIDESRNHCATGRAGVLLLNGPLLALPRAGRQAGSGLKHSRGLDPAGDRRFGIGCLRLGLKHSRGRDPAGDRRRHQRRLVAPCLLSPPLQFKDRTRETIPPGNLGPSRANLEREASVTWVPRRRSGAAVRAVRRGQRGAALPLRQARARRQDCGLADCSGDRRRTSFGTSAAGHQLSVSLMVALRS